MSHNFTHRIFNCYPTASNNHGPLAVSQLQIIKNQHEYYFWRDDHKISVTYYQLEILIELCLPDPIDRVKNIIKYLKIRLSIKARNKYSTHTKRQNKNRIIQPTKQMADRHYELINLHNTLIKALFFRRKNNLSYFKTFH